MKLESKHILNYLNHVLEGDFLGKRDIVTEYDFKHNIISSMNNGSVELKDFVPYLLPLSYLTKEIEHNGERFVPAVELIKLISPYGVEFNISEARVSDDKDAIYVDVTNNYDSLDAVLRNVLRMPIQERKSFNKYYIEHTKWVQIQKLFEWKFDIHGLIPNNLAIEINTIDK